MTKRKTEIDTLIERVTADNGLDLSEGVRKRVEAFAREEIQRAIAGRPSAQREREEKERAEADARWRAEDRMAKEIIARVRAETSLEFAAMKPLQRLLYKAPKEAARVVGLSFTSLVGRL